MELKRKFIKGVMNKDVDERLLPDGEYIDAVNVDVINSEGSDAGTIRNIKGNAIVSDLDDVTNATVANARTIGAVTDEANNRIYWFVTSDNFDGVYEYDETTGNTARVLESTTGQLSFDADYYITGVNIIDGFLYWTDNLNPPRRVNISFAKGFTVDDDRIDEYINVIVAAPLRAPSIEMTLIDDLDDENNENNLEDKFLQFAYRYKYRDNQYSALSPFSAVAFKPRQYEIDYAAGNNAAMLNLGKEVRVTFETGNRFVEEIQVVARDTKNLNTYIVETFKKNIGSSVETIPNYSTHSFIFKNNKVYSVLPSDQVTRLFDNVPLKAKAQEIIDRRLVYGNYTQFYDIVDCNGDDIKIDYEVDYVSEDVTLGTGMQTFRSDRDYEVGIIYGDDYGRFTTVLTNSRNTGEDTVYIPASQSTKSNSLVVKINHKAPCFATHYRLVVKENKKSYYNIFPILYYRDGGYRWFLINESDKNKIKVGEYLSFKTDAEGVIENPKRYKALDVTYKSRNFLGNNELEGLYIKIKSSGGEFPIGALDVTESTSTGYGRAQAVNGNNDITPDPAVTGLYNYVENPIFYGVGNPSMAVVSNTPLVNSPLDIRYTIVVQSGDKIKYTASLTGSGTWIEEDIPISNSVPIKIPSEINASTPTLFNVNFGSSGYTPGDKWTISTRGTSGVVWGTKGTDYSNYTFGIGSGFFAQTNSINYVTNSNDQDGGGPACTILPNNNVNTELSIGIGAVVELYVTEEWFNNQGDTGTFTNNTIPNTSPSPRDYVNIEEWFYESGAYELFSKDLSNNSTMNAEAVTFRRGIPTTSSNGNAPSNHVTMIQGGSTQPVRMIIKSSVSPFSKGGTIGNPPKIGRITGDIKVTQSSNQILAETEPIEIDSQIYHETARTFPIENRQHKVRWEYQDYTEPSAVFGANILEGGAYDGKTIIGFEDPENDSPTSANIPHGYHEGDILYVVSSSTSFGPQAPSLATGYEVLYVIDDYNVIIDLAFPGAGPVTPGTASLYEPGEGTIEDDQNSPTQAAIIKINHPQNENSTYNAYAFGNGLESDRIRDDFNETELQFSPRASIVIDNYEQETKTSGLCYSGIYKGDSSINRLNEFNLSKANFKNLDREFGSVQKLFARDTDLLVLQENKTSKVLYGKNLLSDAVGGGQISSVPEVLGTQIAYAGDYGISFNPESFAEWGNSIWWCDERRGAVLQMTAGQIVDISKYGMKDYFRDMFRDNPKTQKLGVYDPYRHQYILASNDESSVPCELSLSINGDKYPASNPGLEEINDQRPDFYVYSNTSWTCEISYGSGSGWVAGYPASGFGDQAIFLGIADNHTLATRTATLTFTYCGGLTATYTITQARGRRIIVRPVVAHNGKFKRF